MSDRSVTSIERLTGRRPPIEEVEAAFVRHFCDVFDADGGGGGLTTVSESVS